MKKNVLKDLVYIALYAALFIVLDRISDVVLAFVKMPNGGGLNLGTVALLMASYHLGLKKGLITGVVTILLMVVVGSANLSYGVVSFLLDYVIGYLAYCFACIFPKTKYIYFGIIITSMIRIIASTISGIVVFETVWYPSLTYNLAYIAPTMIVDLVLVPILYNSLKPILNK